MSLLYSLLVGAIAGWSAGKLMKGGGFGLLLNIVLGIIGGFVGNWLFGIFNINFLDGIIGDILTAAVGALAILFVAGLFKK